MSPQRQDQRHHVDQQSACLTAKPASTSPLSVGDVRRSLQSRNQNHCQARQPEKITAQPEQEPPPGSAGGEGHREARTKVTARLAAWEGHREARTRVTTLLGGLGRSLRNRSQNHCQALQPEKVNATPEPTALRSVPGVSEPSSRSLPLNRLSRPTSGRSRQATSIPVRKLAIHHSHPVPEKSSAPFRYGRQFRQAAPL